MKIKIGKNTIINYEIAPISGLTGYKINCWVNYKKQNLFFAYWEPNSDKLKNGITKKHKEIIKNIFIGNFTNFYFENVKF